VRLRFAIGTLALVGAAIASYLVVVKLSHSTAICPTSGCAIVERSRYSELVGIPVALFGLLAYLAVFASALRREKAAIAAGAAIAVAGVAYAVYLLVVQLAVINAVCTWCVASDVVVAVLASLSVARIARTSP
jgi:uncharacterized membrane protein